MQEYDSRALALLDDMEASAMRVDVAMSPVAGDANCSVGLDKRHRWLIELLDGLRRRQGFLGLAKLGHRQVRALDG